VRAFLAGADRARSRPAKPRLLGNKHAALNAEMADSAQIPGPVVRRWDLYRTSPSRTDPKRSESSLSSADKCSAIQELLHRDLCTRVVQPCQVSNPSPCRSSGRPETREPFTATPRQSAEECPDDYVAVRSSESGGLTSPSSPRSTSRLDASGLLEMRKQAHVPPAAIHIATGGLLDRRVAGFFDRNRCRFSMLL